MGQSMFEIIVDKGRNRVDFKPDVAYPGTVHFKTHLNDPPCDVYVYSKPPLPKQKEGESDWDYWVRKERFSDNLQPPGCDSWFMVSFDVTPGPGTSVVKTIVSDLGMPVSILRIGRDALLRRAVIQGRGIGKEWVRFVNGVERPVSDAEAAFGGAVEVAVDEISLVITEHAVIAEFLVDKGLAPASAAVVPVADIEDVRGKHIFGNVPVGLAAVARSVTVMEVSGPPVAAKKKKGITIADVEAVFQGVRRYSVTG